MMSAAATGTVQDQPTLGPAGRLSWRASAAGRRRDTLWPLGLYALLSVLLFGLPVLGHLNSRIIASDQIDSSAFMWFFGWWPHALLHGLNPFTTHMMFVPEGFNITWATAVPGPAILLSPITLAFGPAVTWNVVQMASPALSAWTAYILCRHVTARVAPSLLGGYVFGFSPYMLLEMTGAPYLTMVALLPVFVLLVLRRVEGSIGPRRFLVLMTAALAGQYLISAEVLLTATLFGVIALVLAFALLPEQRAALLGVAKLQVGAYAATAILISPFLYFFVVGQHYPPGATYFTADLAGFGLPPPLVAISRQQPPFAGANTETYLGLPLIVLIGLFIWESRRSRTAWLIVLSLVVAGILSLGGYLRVRGHLTSIQLPWYLLGRLPLLRYAITLRFAVYLALPAALIVAIWTSRQRSGVGRWVLALLAVAFIAPEVGNSVWDTHIKDPAFFSSGTYRSYLAASDNVLTVPVWGPNERWQADSGFRFKLAAGYLGNPFPTSYSRYPIWNTLLTGSLTPGYAGQLRRFVEAKGVTAIVVDETDLGPWKQLFGSLGVRPVSTGGVLFYRLRASN